MLALVLDRAHACLLDAGRVLDIPFAGGTRPLRAVDAHFAALGVTLPAPAGSRPRADGGRDFVFLGERFAAPAGLEWRPLRAAGDDAWQLYVTCMLGGWEPPERAVEVWSFGDEPELASRL